MSQQSAEHHTKAAEHHEDAARHHKEAAKHYASGSHEKAGHHAHVAHGHHLHATHHAEEAAKHHVERCPDPPTPNRSARLWLKNRAHRLTAQFVGWPEPQARWSTAWSTPVRQLNKQPVRERSTVAG